MQITFENPGEYKTATKPALHIFFAWIASSLFLTLVTLMFVPDIHANDDVWCNLMFESLWFQEVPPSIQLECGDVFQENIDYILSQHPTNF